MSETKFDIPLTMALAVAKDVPMSEAGVNVTVRTCSPPTEKQVADLEKLGVRADTRRTVFAARLSEQQLQDVAANPCVLRISLSQRLKALAK